MRQILTNRKILENIEKKHVESEILCFNSVSELQTEVLEFTSFVYQHSSQQFDFFNGRLICIL